MKDAQNKKKFGEKGFTLLVAILLTSLLVLVSFAVINIGLKQLILSFSDQESQYAFYAAESGIECALYWDGKPTSAFATSTSGSIDCNGQTVSTASQTVPTVPTVPSLVGGGGNVNPISIWSITLPRGCVIVKVIKAIDGSGDTTIESRGYNSCNTSILRRFERGITLSY